MAYSLELVYDNRKTFKNVHRHFRYFTLKNKTYIKKFSYVML